ncbi:MAG: helix-turn-helix domain-containing protein [bacterium]
MWVKRPKTSKTRLLLCISWMEWGQEPFLGLKKYKNMDEQKEFYLVEELAEKLRVSNMTIYRYIKADKLKAYKIGKEFRIEKKEFDKFLDKVKTKQ